MLCHQRKSGSQSWQRFQTTETDWWTGNKLITMVARCQGPADEDTWSPDEELMAAAKIITWRAQLSDVDIMRSACRAEGVHHSLKCTVWRHCGAKIWREISENPRRTRGGDGDSGYSRPVINPSLFPHELEFSLIAAQGGCRYPPFCEHCTRLPAPWQSVPPRVFLSLKLQYISVCNILLFWLRKVFFLSCIRFSFLLSYHLSTYVKETRGCMNLWGYPSIPLFSLRENHTLPIFVWLYMELK